MGDVVSPLSSASQFALDKALKVQRQNQRCPKTNPDNTKKQITCTQTTSNELLETVNHQQGSKALAEHKAVPSPRSPT
eukprot:2339720-Amphidinium_carterae.1